MRVSPSDIAPSQDFLKEQTLRFIGDCIRKGQFDDLPPAPIVRKDTEGKLVAIDGHNLIAAKWWLEEDIEVHLAESANDGIAGVTEASLKRNQDLSKKFEIVLSDVENIRQHGVKNFDDLCGKYEAVLKDEFGDRKGRR